MHLGVLATLADHTGGSAAYTLVASDERMLTAGFELHLLRPSKGSRLLCKGEVIKAGRTISIAEASVYIDELSPKTIVAKATITVATVRAAQRD